MERRAVNENGYSSFLKINHGRIYMEVMEALAKGQESNQTAIGRANVPKMNFQSKPVILRQRKYFTVVLIEWLHAIHVGR